MTPFFQLDPKIESASAAALQQVAPRFTEIDEVTDYNQLKVLRAFMDNGISERHFGSSTGYGYGDEGRETLDKVWAQVFGRGGRAGAPQFYLRHPHPGGGAVWCAAAGGQNAVRQRYAL